ncbi:hypothetical protein COOONC_12268 [Cooperia oncophora]
MFPGIVPHITYIINSDGCSSYSKTMRFTGSYLWLSFTYLGLSFTQLVLRSGFSQENVIFGRQNEAQWSRQTCRSSPADADDFSFDYDVLVPSPRVSLQDRDFPILLHDACAALFQSHQLFHTCVVIAAFVHYYGISEMAWMRLNGQCPADALSFLSRNEL